MYFVDLFSCCISVLYVVLCIGFIVWVLDVVGLFLYNELLYYVLELVFVFSGLVIMVVSVWFIIFIFSIGVSKCRIVLVSLWLVVGMLVGYFIIISSYV